MPPNCSLNSVRVLTISLVGEGSGISCILFWLFLEDLRAAILKEEEEKALNALNVPEQDPLNTGKRQLGEKSAV